MRRLNRARANVGFVSRGGLHYAASMPVLDVDLSGKTCLVTGASAGIGKAAALALAKMGAHVVLGCRSAEKGEAARAEIAAAVGGQPRVEVMVVDVASQASIRRFAADFSE